MDRQIKSDEDRDRRVTLRQPKFSTAPVATIVSTSGQPMGVIKAGRARRVNLSVGIPAEKLEVFYRKIATLIC